MRDKMNPTLNQTILKEIFSIKIKVGMKCNNIMIISAIP